MKILLTGASGFIGGNLAGALLAQGHQLRPASRRDGVDFCRMQQTADWLPLLDGIDAVINCVGIIGETRGQSFATLHTAAPVALFRACAAAGVRRVLQVSALGADDTAFSAYHLSKRAADDVLRQLDLDWFVLRPSLIYGRGGKSAALFMRLAALPLIPVIGDGQQKLQPVHISDVVATVLQCLGSDAPRQTLDLVGSETISFAEWLQRMRCAQGRPRARLLHIAPGFAQACARWARHLNPILQPENLRMLQQGYWADGQPFRQFLGRPPLAAVPALFFSDAAPIAAPRRPS
jgi:uncharacterized protein YbjT (DUF2867 family)